MHVTLKNLRLLLDQNAVNKVEIVAQGSVFALRINGELMLATQRAGSAAQPVTREFANINTVLALLHELGIGYSGIEFSRWTPKQKTLGVTKK